MLWSSTAKGISPAMSEMLVFFGAWIAIGVVTAIVMGRRGHNPVVWLTLGVGLGPLALVAARASVLREREARTVVAQRGTVGPGPVRVLIGVDGSDASTHALEYVLRLLGPRVGHLEIATVVDYDAATTSSSDEGQSEEILAAAASRAAAIGPCAPVTVVLPGKPGPALMKRASDGGFGLLAVGSRGRGMSKVVFGSVARTVAEAETIPVLIVSPDTALPRAPSPVATSKTGA
jgi:nucleotide-binding universal stress UspA family protein